MRLERRASSQAFVGQQFKAIYYPNDSVNQPKKKLDIEGSEPSLSRRWDSAGSRTVWDNHPAALEGACGARMRAANITRKQTLAQIAKIWCRK